MDKDTEKAIFRLLSMLARMQLVEALERRHDLAARQLQHHVLWLNRVQAKFYEPAAATPAPSALDRLRERVDRAAAVENIELGEWRAFDRVLDMIDEEKAKAGEAKR